VRRTAGFGSPDPAILSVQPARRHRSGRLRAPVQPSFRRSGFGCSKFGDMRALFFQVEDHHRAAAFVLFWLSASICPLHAVLYKSTDLTISQSISYRRASGESFMYRPRALRLQCRPDRLRQIGQKLRYAHLYKSSQHLFIAARRRKGALHTERDNWHAKSRTTTCHPDCYGSLRSRPHAAAVIVQSVGAGLSSCQCRSPERTTADFHTVFSDWHAARKNLLTVAVGRAGGAVFVGLGGSASVFGAGPGYRQMQTGSPYWKTSSAAQPRNG